MKTNFHHYAVTPLIANKKVNHSAAAYKANETKFAETFRQTIGQSDQSLSISRHAQMRMQQRDIHIDSETWRSIEQKVNQAKGMGVKDSLVLLDEAALIVSAKNNVVVTAMSREEASAQIFTNINGTIIM